MSRLVTLIRRRLRSPEDYRALQAYLAERSIAQLARRGVDLSGLRVLEVAAAYGGYSEALHARASLLVASDLHADPHFGRAGIPFVQLDASDTLPFCDGAFDLVYCSSLIEHLPAPQGLLAECRRVLRPRGQLYLTFPPFYSLFLVGGTDSSPFTFLGSGLRSGQPIDCGALRSPRTRIAMGITASFPAPSARYGQCCLGRALPTQNSLPG